MSKLIYFTATRCDIIRPLLGKIQDNFPFYWSHFIRTNTTRHIIPPYTPRRVSFQYVFLSTLSHSSFNHGHRVRGLQIMYLTPDRRATSCKTSLSCGEKWKMCTCGQCINTGTSVHVSLLSRKLWFFDWKINHDVYGTGMRWSSSTYRCIFANYSFSITAITWLLQFRLSYFSCVLFCSFLQRNTTHGCALRNLYYMKSTVSCLPG